ITSRRSPTASGSGSIPARDCHQKYDEILLRQGAIVSDTPNPRTRYLVYSVTVALVPAGFVFGLESFVFSGVLGLLFGVMILDAWMLGRAGVEWTRVGRGCFILLAVTFFPLVVVYLLQRRKRVKGVSTQSDSA
ncbi:MAG: hypothetical protein A07HB70_01397, partial [uncultured archaeon A07HB70]